MLLTARLALTAVLCAAAHALSVTDIQGTSFSSPYAGQIVHNVSGIVTAKDRYGVWILGDPSPDTRASNGLRIYGSSAAAALSIGDLAAFSGLVSEYRPSASPNDLLLTELRAFTTTLVARNHTPTPPVVGLGVDRTPPTGQLSALDPGADAWLAVPANQSLVERVNATLRPDEFGFDFWESLEGMLVQLPAPVALGFPDWHGAFWVAGDWPVTGRNERGGLTITYSADGSPNAHPEAILVGRPLDGSPNPKTALGSTLSTITGIVTYQFGSYTILPLTAPHILTTPPTGAPSAHAPAGAPDPCALRLATYNVENLSPRSAHLPAVAAHIAHALHFPDVVFLQEIQDDTGTRHDGVVSANKTLRALVDAIRASSVGMRGSDGGDGAGKNGMDNGVEYSFVSVDPEDGMDGGQPGGNIRVAYLWRPERISLVPGVRAGNATESTEVIVGEEGLALSLNPGRIEPLHAAWEDARKPLAAAWDTTAGARIFTVNVHYSSKRGSSAPQGDARPPVNGAQERRAAQVEVTADFVRTVLAHDPHARVVVAGDMNEITHARSVFAAFAGCGLHDADVRAGVPEAERYTYVFGPNCQAIDHVFLSNAFGGDGGEEDSGTDVAGGGDVRLEHVHVNTWAQDVRGRASDHDPTVVTLRVCGGDGAGEAEMRAGALVVQHDS